MTVRLFRDVEEAVSREVRRINFDDQRTVDFTVLKDTFDPFTGELVKLPIEPNFYDSSADTNNIQYPHFFVKLLRIRESRKTGEIIPEYGLSNKQAVLTSPPAYQIVVYRPDGQISTPGNTITTRALQIRAIQPGQLLRILKGNNIGTYIVSLVTPDSSGLHTITLSSNLIKDIPGLLFNSTTRVVNFKSPVDLSSVLVGDTFVDFVNNVFTITNTDLVKNAITIDGIITPDLTAGSNINRTGNVLQNSDIGYVSFVVLDPTKPLLDPVDSTLRYSTNDYTSPGIPLDLFYLVRIDSKERATHIDIANRMWEEFNPPRTGLPVIIRSKLSADQLLTQDVITGGSTSVFVSDNSGYNVNDIVFVFNDFVPTKDPHGQGFEPVFTAKVVELLGTDQIVLDTTVPDTFLVADNTKIVSNARYVICMFHLEDHVTKDVEGAQYWSHEFTFWIQVQMDRQGLPVELTDVIQQIGLSIENLGDGTVILED